jgi:quercetin dioxygenase-like cupin family protein
MIHKTKDDRQLIEGPSAYFTGKVWIDPYHLEAKAPSNLTSALVTFEAGARTNWHFHPLGQLLIVTSGEGWTQCEGEEKVTVREGEVIWCPPGHKHWHGATSKTSMSHIAVQEMLDGTNVIWLEAVTDQQYQA